MATRQVTEGDARSRAQQIVQQVVAEQDQRLVAERDQRRSTEDARRSAAHGGDVDQAGRDAGGTLSGPAAGDRHLADDTYLFGPPGDEPDRTDDPVAATTSPPVARTRAAAAPVARTTAPADARASSSRVADAATRRSRVRPSVSGAQAVGATVEKVGRRLRHIVGEVRDSAFADAAQDRLRRIRSYDYATAANGYARILKTGVHRARQVELGRLFDNQAVRWILVMVVGASLFGILLLLALDTMRGVLTL